MTARVNVFWDTDSGCYIAVDLDRPGCCAAGDTRDEVMRELKDAQAAWDQTKAAADNAKVREAPRSLLRPATVAVAPDIRTPEGARQSRANADYYRTVLKPFA